MESKHTPGPWAWFGDAKFGGFYLATIAHGRKLVMDFVRMGMTGAQPRFQVNGQLVKGQELCKFEVARDTDIVGYSKAKENGGVYRYDICGFDHPDARLIAAAPDLLEACEGMLVIMDWLDVPFHFCDDCVYRGESCNGSTDAETKCPICKLKKAVAKAKGANP